MNTAYLVDIVIRSGTGLIKKAVWLAGLFFLVYPLSNIIAAPADLDTSFSGDGYAGAGNAYPFIHPDGRLLAVSTGLLHYSDTGAQLGQGGFALTPGDTLRTTGSAVQSDGKIVLAGYSYTVNNSLGDTVYVVRFNSDLSLDTTFGPSNNGIVEFNTSPNTSTRVHGIGIQPDDKIVLATQCSLGCSTSGNNIIVRLNTDGSFDNSFGNGGETAVVVGNPVLGFDFNNRSVVVSPDGKIYAPGKGLNSAGESGMGVISFNADGSRNTAFGENGIAIAVVDNDSSDEGNGIALQSDGKILVAAGIFISNDRDVTIVRFNTDGQLDSGFANGGIFRFDSGSVFPLSTLDSAYSVLEQPDGKILFGGFGDPTTLADTEGVIGRLNANGTLDSTFGNNGTVIDAATGWYFPAALQPDGKILAQANTGFNVGGIARFEGNAIDLTPDAISFVDLVGVGTSAVFESNVVAVAGLSIDVKVPVKVTNGEYRINAGAYTNTVGTAQNGDQIQLRHTSSAIANTAINTTLSVGGLNTVSNPAVQVGSIVTDVFTSTTAAGAGSDTTPDTFNFTDPTNVATSTIIMSNLITISGINAATPISIIGGEYSVNNAAATSAAGTVVFGDSVTVSLLSSASNSATTSATLTVGGVSDMFDVTTGAAAPPLPANNDSGGGGALSLLLLAILLLSCCKKRFFLRFSS